jgi:hypothetical protein
MLYQAYPGPLSEMDAVIALKSEDILPIERGSQQ